MIIDQEFVGAIDKCEKQDRRVDAAGKMERNKDRRMIKNKRHHQVYIYIYE